jgi:integrase/recombinase XerD
MSVKIWQRQLAGNKRSLYLDINYEGDRSREKLNLYLYKPARTEQERTHNKNAERQANELRSKRELELSASDYKIQPSFKRRIDIIKYFENYVSNYTKKNLRMVQATMNHFKSFLGKNSLSSRQVTEQLCAEFREYLEQKLTGETPYDYFMRFKQMLKQAVRDGILSENPATKVKNRRAEGDLKDILTTDELQTLADTPSGSLEVKRAFLFACNTGLRAADIRALRWGYINNGTLKVTQSKTQKTVSVNLNSTALQLLGEPAKPEQPVFTLPSQNAVNKTLKAWAKRAKVDKHVTFHCARHTFGTNLIIYGGSVVSVSNLLGHTSLKHTMRYVRAVESMKEQAVNNLPPLQL